MSLCCRSPHCLQLAQEQAAARQSFYVNGDSAAGQAGILAKPPAGSRRTIEACKVTLFQWGRAGGD